MTNITSYIACNVANANGIHEMRVYPQNADITHET